MPEMSSATADAQPPPADAIPPIAGVRETPKTAHPDPARVGAACRRTVLLGYALVFLGTAAVPVAPLLKSTLIARLILTTGLVALLAGAGLVVWGFVRTTLTRRP
jgi:hypothetical protein